MARGREFGTSYLKISQDSGERRDINKGLGRIKEVSNNKHKNSLEL
jgi:hypothetical protein